MPANTVEVYDLQDLEKPFIPPRSRLYHLEPVGIGTPYVESLTSYINRLARAHCVEPMTLVIHEILPYLRKLGGQGSTHQRLLTINGIGFLTNQWVQAVEELSLCRNLRFLTMLTWSNVIDFHGVVHNTRAWCPSCYEEALQTGQIIYDPLIWSLRVMTRCPRHHQSLSYRCPNQNCQSVLPYFSGGSRPGYCPKCESCLSLVPPGVDLGAESISEDELRRLLWQEHAVSELIAAAPDLTAPLEREAVGFGITLYMDQAMTGSLASLADKLGVVHHKLVGWQRGQHLPRFNILVQLCYRMGVSPLSFLVKQARESTAVLSQVGTDSPLGLGEGRCKPMDIENVRQQLEAILADGKSFPLSLKRVASRLGYPVPILQYHFPQLCDAIAVRYRKLLDADKQRQVLETALANDASPPPSVKELARHLGCSAKTLRYRFPEECRVIAERRRKTIDIDILRQALERVLESREVPFPTEKEIARRLGCGHSTLRKHFPTLCQAIAKQRRKLAKPEELQGVRVGKRRKRLDIENLRQTLEELLQGHETPPPTVIEVARRLGCNDTTLRKHFPDLCNEIAKRGRKRHDFDSLQRSLEAVLLSNERPPSLKELARRLDCSATTLSEHFPELCAQITERHRGWGDADDQRRVLEAALTSEAASSLSVNEIARLLGCSSSTLFKRFPELCEAITKRRWELSDAEVLRQALEAVLVNDEHPPSLTEIAKRLGCHTQSLKYYFPELCAAIIGRRREPSAADSLRCLQQALEGVVGSDEDPVSMQEVARRLGCSASFLLYHFPEQCRAISARYLAHRKSRSQARISRICDEVKKATFLIHSGGEYPSQRLLTPLLRYPTVLRQPEFRRAWREALRELGYDF